MSFVQSVYRYNQALAKGRAYLKLAIGILSLWATFMVLTINFTKLSILSNSNIHLDWGYYIAGMIYFTFAISLALFFGFKASDAEHKESDIIIERLFSNNVEDSVKTELVDQLDENTSRLDKMGVKSLAGNLFAIASLIIANILLFFTIDEVWNVIKEFKFYFNVVLAIIITMIVCFWPSIKSFLTRRKNKKIKPIDITDKEES